MDLEDVGAAQEARRPRAPRRRLPAVLAGEFAGDNFIRISGDTVNHAKSQMFSWEAGAKGLDVHALAEPTKLEALKKEYEAKKKDFKSDAKQSVLDKYVSLLRLPTISLLAHFFKIGNNNQAIKFTLQIPSLI